MTTYNRGMYCLLLLWSAATHASDVGDIVQHEEGEVDIENYRAVESALLKKQTISEEMLATIGDFSKETINYQSPTTQQTLLHLATGTPDLTKLLLTKGANTDITNRAGRTPLALAILSGNMNSSVELLQKCANANAADLNGKTPLYHAATVESIELCTLLLNHGADPQNDKANKYIDDAVFDCKYWQEERTPEQAHLWKSMKDALDSYKKPSPSIVNRENLYRLASFTGGATVGAASAGILVHYLAHKE